MPWGLTRFHHSGQSYFVSFCCYHRRRLFTADTSRRIFESALERVRRSFRLQVYGYVVMPEHVHLLAEALRSLKQGVARRLLRPQRAKYALAGDLGLMGDADHFWQNGITISTFEITRSLWRS